MGADLFGSYVATVLATMVLGRETDAMTDAFAGMSPILLPMLIASMGIIFSIIGTFFVRISESAGLSTHKVQNALNMGNWGSMVLTAIGCYFLVQYLMPEHMILRGHDFTKNGVFGAIMVGLVVGALMSIITEYYTAMGKRPVMSIIRQSGTGHATNIIGGLAVGMESTMLPILVLAGGIYGSYACAGLYGVAIAAAGMMATTAMQLAIDAFGPIADNAGGIAEMSELPADVREKTDILDAVGNTTAASGKGFAIASAALTALALFAAFVGIAKIDGIDIYHADVLAGLFVGGMIPFIFSSLAIKAVGEAAMAMVEEVRRQFRTIPGIMEGTGKPEYDKCVAISTEASLKKMMLPGAIALLTPIIIGFVFGPEVLGGFLAGATVCGVLMGIFQNNAGGAWDNAKKSFEKGVDINGEMHYKKSEPHKASVTGDTVGDPFKDTSGPSMNILIKLMSIVSLVIAPTLAKIHHDKIEGNRKAQIATMMKMEGLSAAVVNTNNTITTTGDNGIVTTAPAIIPAGKVNADGDYVYEGGTPTVLKLSDGTVLHIGANAAETRLADFINDNNKHLDKAEWYTLERIYFQPGTADMKPESQEQINNLAAILKTNPNVYLKLGGFTDNTGNNQADLALSLQRVDVIKEELVRAGVPANRLDAEGYGNANPVCAANDTPECKAQNRRVAILVTKK